MWEIKNTKLDIQGTITIVSEMGKKDQPKGVRKNPINTWERKESQDGANFYYNERQENHHHLSILIIMSRRRLQHDTPRQNPMYWIDKRIRVLGYLMWKFDEILNCFE